tara:strand:+ start:2164 stop:2868 length:705 start_codon:yes stop_codon:yes gene_type:complete
MKPTIQVADNLFPAGSALPEVGDIAQFVADYCYDALYMYGEADNPFDAPTGLTHQIQILDEHGRNRFDHRNNGQNEEQCKLIYNIFMTGVGEKYPKFWDLYQIYRLYINYFGPREQANFHRDCDLPDDPQDEAEQRNSNQITLLYYPKHRFDYTMDEGGCTEFYMDDRVIGIPPTANSMSYFTSTILHRATPFRSHSRFTVAAKCCLRSAVKVVCDGIDEEFIKDTGAFPYGKE